MYYNINYEIAAIILLIILMIGRREYFKSTNKINIQFMRVIMLVLTTCVVNIVAALSYSNYIPVDDQMMLFIETIYLILAMFSCYLQLVVIVSRCNYESNVVHIVNFILVGFVSIILLINLSGKFVFEYIDHVFTGHTLFTFMYLVYVVMFIEMAVFLISNRHHIRSQIYILICGVMICPLAGILIQFLNDRLLLSGLGATAAFIIYSFSLEDEDYEKWQNTLNDLEVSKEKEQQNRKDAMISSRVKTIFMRSVSNELREPIKEVMTLSGRMSSRSREEEVINYAEKINESGKQLLSFVDELIEVSGGED